MDPFPSSVSAPKPAFRTVSLRLPMIRGGALAVALGVVVVIGACAVAGWSLHRHGAEAARWDQARQQLDPSVAKVLERNRTRLDDLETDLRALNQIIDHGLAASASAGIDLARVRSGQDDFAARLDRIADDLNSIGLREDSTENAYRLPADADDTLLTERQRSALAVLRQRQGVDAGQLDALDDRIAALARHRESVVLAEQATAATAFSRPLQAKTEPIAPAAATEASDAAAPAPTRSERLMADAAQMQADALAPSSGPVARAASETSGPATNVVIPEDPTPPPAPPPAPTVVVEQPPAVTTYYFGYSSPYIDVPYYYRPYRYYSPGPSLFINIGGHGGHDHGPGGPPHHH